MVLYEYTTGKNHELETRISLYTAEPKFYIKMPDGEEAPVFDYKNFPFEIFVGAPVISKKGKSRDRVQYYNLATAFDIETTTILSDDPYAFMYQWQYCIEDYVFMGQTWEEFQEFTAIVCSKLGLYVRMCEDHIIGKSLVTYVFNLSYEFQFMRHFIGELVHPLITDKYQPLLIPTAQGITYRCAYRLTNKTLEKFTKGFPHAKLAGDLDYSVKRVPHAENPKNGLTDLELAYCYNDTKGLCEAIRDRLVKDKYNIASIPLTSTGYVRKDVQKAMNAKQYNRANFQRTKLTPHLYRLCRAAFRGGNTHANSRWTKKLIGIPCGRYDGTGKLKPEGGNIKHYDIASSYPASILTSSNFPMGPFQEIDVSKVDVIKELDNLTQQYCLLIRVRIADFEYIGKCGVPYIARSKTMFRLADIPEIVEDNGRVFKAPLAELVLTEIDARIILRDYRIKKIQVVEAYKSLKGMLPVELRQVVQQYYALKTSLKHAPEPEQIYNYNKAKENLNSTYGMMVMRIDRLEFQYEANDYLFIPHSLQEQIDTYYDSKSNCLPYQWGVWVTANSRARLQEGLDICGKDLLYTDTDSVFYIGDHEKEFEQLNKKLEAQAILSGAVASNSKGEVFPIGIWDREPDSLLFMTLGAKKYLLSTDGEHIETTIAGVSKKLGAEFFTKHGFEAFTNNTVIPDSGKISAKYNNDMPHYINIDGVRILTASNIALVPTEYTVHITDKYDNFIETIRQSLYK